MNYPIYKTKKPGWFIKRKFINYIVNDKHGGFYSDQALSKTSKPKSVITKGSYRNQLSTNGLTKLYNKHLNKIIKSFTGDSYFMNTIWYQYYGKNSGSYHNYHNHFSPNCKLSGIYYLRLKDPKLKTEFLNMPELSIGEGDISLFDSQAMHRSPPNYTESEKIILSFNLDRIK